MILVNPFASRSTYFDSPIAPVGTSIINSDLAAIQGTVLFGAFIIVVANLVVDILYAFLDPRVRY